MSIESLINQHIRTVTDKVLNVLAVEAEKSIKKNFEVGGRPPWQPRKKISKKQKGRKLLVIKGNLKNVSAEVDTANSRVILKPNPLARAYARIHQEGGEINMPPRIAKFRRKPSGRTVFASRRTKNFERRLIAGYKIKIPARPYMVIPKDDYGRIISAVKKAL